MFGFKKMPCSDMDLYGYLTQAFGGTVNRLDAIGGGRFDAADIIKLIDLMLDQRKRTIDSRQRSLVKFAAEEVTKRYYTSGDNNKIKLYCDRFAEMMRSEFDFSDPAFNGLHMELALMGCSFNY